MRLFVERPIAVTTTSFSCLLSALRVALTDDCQLVTVTSVARKPDELMLNTTCPDGTVIEKDPSFPVIADCVPPLTWTVAEATGALSLPITFPVTWRVLCDMVTPAKSNPSNIVNSFFIKAS